MYLSSQCMDLNHNSVHHNIHLLGLHFGTLISDVYFCGICVHQKLPHYSDVIISTMASKITGISIVYLNICARADQRKHQSSVSLAFVRAIHWWPVNSLHKGPVTRKMFPIDDVIIWSSQSSCSYYVLLSTISLRMPSLVRFDSLRHVVRHLVHPYHDTFMSWWYLPRTWPSVTDMQYYYHARYPTDDRIDT